MPVGYVNFSPDDDDDSRNSNLKMAEYRANVIFGAAEIDDWFAREEPKTFELMPSEFIRWARRMRPENPQSTASAFSQWIYSLYSSADGSEDDRERGREAEQAIFEKRLTAYSSVDDHLLRSMNSDWELVHNGLHLEGDDRPNYFSISDLSVRGHSMRASPDLLYRNRKTSDVVIVEIKNSRMPLPTNLWPNIWAQLWCYSHIDIARSARNLTVIGEVWGEERRKPRIEEYDDEEDKLTDEEVRALSFSERFSYQCRQRRRRVVMLLPFLRLRASVRRNPRAPSYDRFFRTLFEIYSRGR